MVQGVVAFRIHRKDSYSVFVIDGLFLLILGGGLAMLFGVLWLFASRGKLMRMLVGYIVAVAGFITAVISFSLWMQ